MPIQEADVLKECIMLSDGLMLLPDCFTANDINAVIDYLCCDVCMKLYFLVFCSIFITTVLRSRLHNK